MYDSNEFYYKKGVSENRIEVNRLYVYFGILTCNGIMIELLLK